MALLWLFQIFGIFGFYVGLAKGDCTSCLPIPVECDPDPGAFDSINGVFTQSIGTDEHGCKVVNFSCADDAGSTDGGYMYDSRTVSSWELLLLRTVLGIFLYQQRLSDM